MKKKWKEHRGEVLDTKNGYDVIECVSCGFRHIVPLPSDRKLAHYYRDLFFNKEQPKYFMLHEKDSDWWRMVYGEWYAYFEKQLPRGRRKIADIGSGPGYFLKLGKERGWECVGIEPSKKAAEYSRSFGLEIINEFLDAKSVKNLGTFDVVHAQYVIEHIPDPKNFITLCSRLIRPGGLFSVVAANDYNPLQKALRQHFGYEPWWVVPPEHVNYFTISSLQHTILSCGLKILRTTTSFPMEIFLLMGDNYVGNATVGRECHERRKNLELALTRSGISAVKSEVYKVLAKHDLGRDVTIIARKPR